MSVLISVRTCRYFPNNIQGFFYVFLKCFYKPFFDQAENGMFLPDIKNIISILYTEDRKKLIFKTLIITCDINRDQSSVEMNKRSVEMNNQKTFVSIPFTTQISPFLKK